MFTAAGLAGANAMKTGFTAMKLAVAGFIAPFMYVYDPALLMMGSLLLILLTTLKAVVALFAMSVCFAGYLATTSRWWERLLMGVGGFLLIFVTPAMIAAGGVCVLAGLFSNLIRFKLAQKISVTEPAKG